MLPVLKCAAVLQRAPGHRGPHAADHTSPEEALRGGRSGHTADGHTAGGSEEHEDPAAETSAAAAETDGGEGNINLYYNGSSHYFVRPQFLF